MLRSSNPPVAEFVLDLLSWEYHELLMAGAGKQAEDALERVVREHAGEYIAVVEGAIPTADGGVYCTIGGKTALEIAKHVCGNAAANIAVGACAWDGGLVRANPNPTGAVGLQEAVPGLKNLINLGGCPHNPANTAAVLVHYLTFHDLPALDQYNRPLFAYGNIIHDQCERRAHYDAGRFVEEWGDEGHRKGYCLYKMGCKGPEATYNCPTVRWNDGTSWPVKAGHGCIACASHRFWDTKSPFYKRLPSVPWLWSGRYGGRDRMGRNRSGGRGDGRPSGWQYRARQNPAEEVNRRDEGTAGVSRSLGGIQWRGLWSTQSRELKGHLRIEAQVEGGMISDAWSSGTMFRGIELILRGRDPREAWIWAQRICGVCTMVHALASVNAVEDALGIEVPDNARLIRNIIAATQTIQDHVIHFYHLHALDWVDVVSALKADPAKTSQLAQSISDWPMSSEKYFKGVQDRVSRPGREQATEPVRRGILGTSRLPSSAGSKPHGRRTLPRGAAVPEGIHPNSRGSRRQKSSPADVSGRRHGHLLWTRTSRVRR